MLHEHRYRVLEVLGTGGFGVTYLVEELTHGGLAAIKEYLPSEVAVRHGNEVLPRSSSTTGDFDWGFERFLDEARTLAHFEHAHVVRVHGYFEANNTAYIVMEYEDGRPLSVLLERHGTLTEEQLKRVIFPILDGLREVHSRNFLHRDIKPSNVYVRRSDDSPVLLDFGAARQAFGRRSRKMTALITPGYSPPEQYESASEAQGYWSDIYALAALCYRAITGKAPAASLRRRDLSEEGRDPVVQLADQCDRYPGYSTAMLGAVDWALRLDGWDRPHSVDEWLSAIEGRAEFGGSTSVANRTDHRASTTALAPRRCLLVGRGRDMDVTLPHTSVSRVHAELLLPHQHEPDGSGRSGYIVKDCGSSNGTFVLRGNRWAPISEVLVRAHDRLRLGDYETSAEDLAAMAGWPEEDSDDCHREGGAYSVLADVGVRRDPRSGELMGG